LRKIDAAKDKKAAMHDYIDLVRKARGDAAAGKLIADSREQWGKGNRGNEWK
jgi:hypothetical protein